MELPKATGPRLETNFEKHLNTHGLTRRQEKAALLGLYTGEEAAARPGEEAEEEEGRPRPSYHTMKKAVFLPEEKARSVISGYIVAGIGKGERELHIECALCQFRHRSEIEVYEHIALEHLMIYQYRCDFCSVKVKIKRHLVEHLAEQHGVDPLGETTEMVLEQAADGRVSLVSQEGLEQEVKAEEVESGQVESTITLNVPVTKMEAENGFKAEGIGEDFPYEEHNMRLQVGPNGSKKVFVGSAPQPLLRHNRSVLGKLAKGKLLTKKQADEMVFGYTIHNAQNNMYECTLCNGAVLKHKSYLVQRHLYDHFNIYFHRCDLCHDIFRFATQFKEHQEAHKKAGQKVVEEQERQRATEEQELLGSFHLAAAFTFLPPGEARGYVESCYRLQQTQPKAVYRCKLCTYTVDINSRMYNHCLKHHLKINQYRCDVCDEQVQTDLDIKRHYLKTHGKKLEMSSKLDSLAKTDEHYESLETDVPGVEDLSDLPMEQLRGKKISTRQAKSIKGTHMIFNEESRLHECELCDYRREWRGNLQFHVLATHYQVHCTQRNARLLMSRCSSTAAP
jgi:hypothetical protein